MWQSTVSHLRKAHRKKRKRLCAAYGNSKRRLLDSYESYRNTSFAGRCEGRCEKLLFEGILQLATTNSTQLNQTPSQRLDHNLERAWAIPTTTWVDFMLCSYQKYTALIDTCSLTSSQTGVPYERSKFMLTLFKILAVSRYGLLCCDRRDAD